MKKCLQIMQKICPVLPFNFCVNVIYPEHALICKPHVPPWHSLFQKELPVWESHIFNLIPMIERKFPTNLVTISLMYLIPSQKLLMSKKIWIVNVTYYIEFLPLCCPLWLFYFSFFSSIGSHKFFFEFQLQTIPLTSCCTHNLLK